MAVSKLELDIELKTSAEKLWKNLKEFITFFPKALPHIYEKIDVIEGDGSSAGSIFVCTFKSPEMAPTKERVEMVDEDKKLLSYSFIEGEILKNYKSFKSMLCVSNSSKSDGALVKYSVEFEKANAEVGDPDFFKGFVAKIFEDMDTYLLKA
ncbi:MLP-like protein 423 [Salvia miltiorrhiza]|uniref:MLP-like protein 423 n=1 Tax=Salvia miltiorrhiza TaxID=226208 RepID=UPI0025AC0502|nr:MLP-like protein 423 [Salvia miltiorrhiza]